MKSFLKVMKNHSKLELIKVRGLRIVSGGVLRPLENYRWWWKFNRWLGEQFPSFCIEIQAIMEKPATLSGADTSLCHVAAANTQFE